MNASLPDGLQFYINITTMCSTKPPAGPPVDLLVYACRSKALSTEPSHSVS